jgi:hypothetical protein
MIAGLTDAMTQTLILASVPIPKFAIPCGTLFANFGTERVQAKLMIPGVVFEFEVPIQVRRRTVGTSNPPHWSFGPDQRGGEK